MSKSYSQCCKEVGLDRSKQMPELQYRWVGYSGGKIVECRTMAESMEYSLNERLITEESAKMREDFLRTNIEKEKKALELFHSSLRKEYSELSDDLYKLCYAEAYSRGHSAGLDEVSTYLGDVVYFAKKVQEIESCYN